MLHKKSLLLALFGPALLPLTLSLSCAAAPIVLTKGETSDSINRMYASPAGDLCLAGQRFDPEGDARTRGLILLVSLSKQRVLWQRTVEPPDENEGSRFMACRTDGQLTYAAANVDTSTIRTDTHGLVYVYQFDTAGKMAKPVRLATTADNAFVYDLDVDADGVSVIGMAQDGRAQRRTNGIFLARLDAGMRPAGTTKLPTGAYDWSATGRLSGRTALLGGNFAPAAISGGDWPHDYAVSKIVAGKYSFSVRPQRGKRGEIATTITAANEIVSLGVQGTASRLTVVGADGKVSTDTAVRSTLCEVGSLAATASTVYAVRAPCGDPTRPHRLVAIDRASGSETAVGAIVGVPQEVFVAADRVLVVTKKGDDTLLLETLQR
ncbi:hypothetical protein E7V67_004805 [[Empedobacter] haloabium]|uniref:Uncharacterized protein n=1 Tax=[Empedobacter] haloabium TaxID=592317 RepID=A0ABZ1UQX1_9BURK